MLTTVKIGGILYLVLYECYLYARGSSSLSGSRIPELSADSRNVKKQMYYFFVELRGKFHEEMYSYLYFLPT
jgi:hypothetical protein